MSLTLKSRFAEHAGTPAFLRKLVHLLVGPLWIVAKALGRA